MKMTANEALDKLKSGNSRFVNNSLQHPLQDGARRDSLTGGQAPWAIILSCADSRVVPEVAFDAGLGEIFVIRVAGNVANPESTASIEYAVAHLGTELIVVLGHQSCGAVTAAIAGGDNGPNLNQLLDQIQPAVKASDSDEVNAVVRKNAEMTAERLLADSAILRDAASSGKLSILPAFYSLDDGSVSYLADLPSA